MIDDINKMCDLERLLESRFEKACEKDDWIATAMIPFGTQKGKLVLEKFSKVPISVTVRRDVLMRVRDFVVKELNIHYLENEKVFAEEEEVIPNTINPHHYTITATVQIQEWLKKPAA